MTFQESLDKIESIDGDSVDEGGLSIDEAKEIIHDTLNMAEIASNMDTLFSRSPLLQKQFLPFPTSVTQLVCSAEADQKEHQDRLDQVIHLCGMTRLSVTGEGNCCFIAIAEALRNLYNNSSTNIQGDTKSLPVNFFKW